MALINDGDDDSGDDGGTCRATPIGAMNIASMAAAGSLLINTAVLLPKELTNKWITPHISPHMDNTNSLFYLHRDCELRMLKKYHDASKHTTRTN